jgi:WD40 repeat protein
LARIRRRTVPTALAVALAILPGLAHAHGTIDAGGLVVVVVVGVALLGLIIAGVVLGAVTLAHRRRATDQSPKRVRGVAVASQVVGVLLVTGVGAGFVQDWVSGDNLVFWTVMLAAGLLALLAGFLWPPRSGQKRWWRVLIILGSPLLAVLLPAAAVRVKVQREHEARRHIVRNLRNSIAGAACVHPRWGSDDPTIVSCPLSLSPDGKLVATGSTSTDLVALYPQLHSVQSSAWLPLTRRASPARAVAICAEGKVLAIIEQDGELRLWSVPNEDYLPGPNGALHKVRTVACSRSSIVVLGSDEGRLQLLALDPPRVLVSTEADQPISAVAIAADGGRVAWATGAVVRVAAIQKGRLRASQELAGHTSAVTSLSMSADGKLLASASRDSTVILWNATSGRQLRVVQRASSPRATQVAISADGQRLAVASHGWPIWQCPLPACEYASRQSLDTRRPGPGEGASEQELGRDHHGIAFSPDGRQLAVGHEGHLALWDAAWKEGSGQRLRVARLTGHGDSVSFSPDGKLVALAGARQPARLFAISAFDATLPPHPPHHADSIRSVSFSPSGTRVASGSDDGTIRVWATAPTFHQLHVLVGGHGSVLAVAFGPRDDQLAAGHRDGTVTIWSPEAKAPRRVLAGTHPVTAASYSNDGKRLAAVDEFKIRLWDLESGRLARTLHATKPTAAVFGPDGGVISGHDADRASIRWWSASGKELAAAKPEAPEVDALAISPDGKLLASCHRDGTVRLWSASRRQCHGILYRGDGALGALSFSASGEVLAAIQGSAVLIFRADLSKLDPVTR